MKKILLVLAMSAIALCGYSQKRDWAQFGRYEKANKEFLATGVRPDAVFMGNSITDGWASKDPEFFKKNNFVCNIQNSFLMGNNKDVAFDAFVHSFKHSDKTVEAPQVDACFRFIKEGQFCTTCQNHSDFDSFQFAAGKGSINFTVDVVTCAQTNF